MFYWDDGDQYFKTIQEACEHFETDEERVPEQLELCERAKSDSFLGEEELNRLLEKIFEHIEENVPELSNEDWSFSDHLSDDSEMELKKAIRLWLNVHFNSGDGVWVPSESKTVPFRPIYQDWLKRYDESGNVIAQTTA